MPRLGALNPRAQCITAGLQKSQGGKEGSKPSWRNLGSNKEPKSCISSSTVFLWDSALVRKGPDSHIAQHKPGEERKVTHKRESGQGRGRERQRQGLQTLQRQRNRPAQAERQKTKGEN